MSTTTTNSNTPKLRFPGFDEKYIVENKRKTPKISISCGHLIETNSLENKSTTAVLLTKNELKQIGS
jgi:hypothetical protein